MTDMTSPPPPPAPGLSRRGLLAGILLPGAIVTSAAEAREVPGDQVGTLFVEPADPAGAGRSGLFVWDATVPVAQHRLDTADPDGIGEGVYIAPAADRPGAWKRVIEQSVSPGWFGLEAGTGKSAEVWERNRRALQKAIDFALFSGSRAAVAIPAGSFEFSGTLHLGYGESFRSLSLTGAGRGYGATPGSGTILLHKGSTAHQALNWQGMRNPRLEHLTLIGQLAAFYGSLPQASWIEEDNWLPPPEQTPGRADRGDGRHNPYAGLTVDAYCGARPAAPYPEVASPPAAGPPAHYGRRASSQMTLNDVEIRGFNTGIVLHPGDSDGNGDYLSLDRCAVLACKYGLSIGNGQSRYVSIDRTLFGPCYLALTNRVHGRRIGQFGGTIANTEFAACWLADFVMSFVAPTSFINCGSEALFGILRAEGSTGSLRFLNPNFNFHTLHEVAVPAHVVAGPEANVVFDGGSWRHSHPIAFESPLVRVMGYPMAYWIETTASMPAWKVPFVQSVVGGIVPARHGMFNRTQLVWRAARLSPDRATQTLTGWSKSDEYLSTPAAPGRGALFPLGQTHFSPANLGIGAGREPLPRPVWRHERPKAQTRWSLADRILSLDVPGLTDETAFWYGYLPGDMIRCLDSGTVFIVRAREGTRLTAEQQTNYWQRPGHPPVTPVPAAGTWECVCCRLYAFAAGPASFTATAGSPVVAVAGPFPAELRPGDALLFPLYGEEFILSGAAFETRVIAVDATARSITMAGPARRSGNSRHAFALSAAPPGG